MFSYTMLLYLFLTLKGEEKFQLITFLPVLAAFIGLALVVGVLNKFHDLSIPGLALSGLAAFATATRMYRYGKLLKNADPAVIGAETFSIVMLFCCLLMLYQLPVMPASVKGWGWALLAGSTMAIANFGMFYGIALLGSFKFAFFIKMEPVFGAIISFLLLGEILQPYQYVGMALVVGSLCVYQLLQERQKAKSVPILPAE